MSTITLRKLKNTSFPQFYKKFLETNEMSDAEKIKLLRISIILMNTDDDVLKKLGYRMILKYTNKFNYYIPLFDIAINEGFIPITKYIEKRYLNNLLNNDNFLFQYISSFEENFRNDDIYLTEEQLELNKFFSDNNNNALAIVAPTSYGKSELIMSCIQQNPTSNICILVPTKSLLAQTKRRIFGNKNFNKERKIITHPEMYISTDNSFVAVLTQERLLRILQHDEELSFDYVVVDEAHNLLSNDPRSKLLASALVILNHRNRNTTFKFLTPFIQETRNFKVNYTNYDLIDYKISENIKSENYYYYDFKNNPKLVMYDQFLNDHYIVDNTIYSSDIELIKAKSLNKNIIYLNKPVNIEDFSKRLLRFEEEISNEIVDKAIKDIASYIHSDYLLIKCLKKGFVYHHGSVPENIRLYIEHLFSIIEDIKYIITSSTLLEGVNIPADSIFLLESKKGNSNLNNAQFKNLVGRVSRFGDIFHEERGSLSKLEPSVYVIKSQYMHNAANIKKYLERTVRVDKEYGEIVENVLLANTEINEENEHELIQSIQFIENQEVGATEESQIIFASTEAGKACYKNSIIEFDILKYERSIQNYVEIMRNEDIIIDDHNDILKYINILFVSKIENHDNGNLKRLEHIKSRDFYSMFIDWKIKQASYNEMISNFIRYWNKLISHGSDTQIYVGKWGDQLRLNENDERSGYQYLWTDISTKSKSEMINLAIVRIKEEQDFLENNLMKFIETLYDLGLLSDKLYFNIKYGTSDETIITMVKNGIGLQTAKLMLEKYSDYIQIDNINNTITIDKEIINQMRNSNENEIVIYEVLTNIGE